MQYDERTSFTLDCSTVSYVRFLYRRNSGNGQGLNTSTALRVVLLYNLKKEGQT